MHKRHPVNQEPAGDLHQDVPRGHPQAAAAHGPRARAALHRLGPLAGPAARGRLSGHGAAALVAPGPRHPRRGRAGGGRRLAEPPGRAGLLRLHPRRRAPHLVLGPGRLPQQVLERLRRRRRAPGARGHGPHDLRGARAPPHAGGPPAAGARGAARARRPRDLAGEPHVPRHAAHHRREQEALRVPGARLRPRPGLRDAQAHQHERAGGRPHHPPLPQPPARGGALLRDLPRGVLPGRQRVPGAPLPEHRLSDRARRALRRPGPRASAHVPGGALPAHGPGLDGRGRRERPGRALPGGQGPHGLLLLRLAALHQGGRGRPGRAELLRRAPHGHGPSGQGEGAGGGDAVAGALRRVRRAPAAPAGRLLPPRGAAAGAGRRAPPRAGPARHVPAARAERAGGGGARRGAEVPGALRPRLRGRLRPGRRGRAGRRARERLRQGRAARRRGADRGVPVGRGGFGGGATERGCGRGAGLPLLLFGAHFIP
mmetsp:Transcript_82900/g.257803  ORF Transcript_82900/g.257803 Transcript_82900/m.257803 type:complete len:485 (+) Transcript_82900:337-1791(+)